MKLKQLAAAMLAAATTTTAAYANDVSVYGKINVSMSQYDIDALGINIQDNWELESNASRLGVKGSFAINNNLKAIYKIEFETHVDDGQSSLGRNEDTLEQRNIYAGFQGDWGTLIAGKHDTPTKLAQGKIDRFNDLPLGDIRNVFVGENRENNIVMYTTPNLNGFSVTAAIIPGEESGTGNNDDDGIADAFSAVVTYKRDQLYLALATDSDVNDNDIIRLVGEYTLGDFKIGALLQDAEEAESNLGLQNGAKEQDGYLLSGEWSLDSWVFKAQYAYAENYFILISDDLETTQMIFGADYKLNKQAKIYSYYSNITTEFSGIADPFDGSTFAVGYEIKF